MLKRELKINFKSFLIWTVILMLMFLVVYLVYPFIISSENIELMDEMMAMFPEEMLKAFNMDLSSIDTVFGWLKTEGFIFVLLIVGAYASILGSTIVLKEENDKTIEYLNSLPIKRKDILFSKIKCAIIYIVLMVLIVGIFNYIGLELSGNFDRKQYILLSFTPILSALPLFSFSLFISMFMHKTKSSIGISLGIVFVSYFLQIISGLSDVTKSFKYFTVYTLSDIRNVILNVNIDPIMIILSLLMTILFIIGTYIKYEKKELL